MTLRLSAEARDDLFQIWSYIAQDNLTAANRLVKVIASKMDLLRQFPYAGRGREELGEGLRSFVVRKYLIFYSIDGNVVDVFRVLHGSRDIEVILGR
jgi:toxin ParE1/3/4